MFAVKKLEALLILVEKYAHVSLENFFWPPPPPVDNIFGNICTTWSKS
jgi:hypothetical protein